MVEIILYVLRPLTERSWCFRHLLTDPPFRRSLSAGYGVKCTSIYIYIFVISSGKMSIDIIPKMTNIVSFKVLKGCRSMNRTQFRCIKFYLEYFSPNCGWMKQEHAYHAEPACQYNTAFSHSSASLQSLIRIGCLVTGILHALFNTELRACHHNWFRSGDKIGHFLCQRNFI